MRQNAVIILASESPRRSSLLSQAGFEFVPVPSGAEESISIDDPSELVLGLSMLKAESAAAKMQAESDKGKSLFKMVTDENARMLILGADTTVALDGQIFGKPQDAGDAFRMLMSLSGKAHEVYTGVAGIICSRELDITERFSFYERTEVEMYDFSETEAIDYISTGEPGDKAGAYGIQGKGARLVRGIRGDYNNVVGLPVPRLMKELEMRGLIEYGS